MDGTRNANTACFSIQVKSIHNRMKILLIKYWRNREILPVYIIIRTYGTVRDDTMEFTIIDSSEKLRSYRVNSLCIMDFR